MNCPFCGADARTQRRFQCWTLSDLTERSGTCMERENESLKARVAELEVDNKAMRDRIAKLEDCIETAWGIIANAGGGDWNTQTPKWKEAAESWRDNKFHPILNDTFTVRAKMEGGAR